MTQITKEDMELLQNSKISVVVPAHNEELNILTVIQNIPDYVDHIVITDDLSSDNTVEIIEKECKTNPRVVLLKHEKNQGVGGAIATGYEWSRDHKVDAAVVMAGDNQMDPDDMPPLLLPVLRGEVNYAKANRLLHPSVYETMPKVRFWGSSILSFLTKISSGYWHVSDPQNGYTAIDLEALETINWEKMYRRYGQPNDLLVSLNINNFTVMDVTMKPVYNVGEKSGIKIKKVIFTIGWLLVKRFFRRLFLKYVYYDFHPLVLFYFIAFIMMFVSVILFFWVGYRWIGQGFAPPMASMAFMFASTSSLQSFFFAMWMDMEANKHLRR